MIGDVAVLLVALACWIGFGYKLRHLRQRATEPGAPALRALVVVLGLTATLATVTPQCVAGALDPVTGLSGLTRLVANVVSMATCLSIVAWLLFLSRPQEEATARLTMHLRIFAAALTVVLALFALDHPPVSPDREFTGAHTYVFIAYDIYAVTALIRMSWRYASVVEAPLLRLGLRLVAVGVVFGLATMVILFTYLLNDDLRLGLPGSLQMFRPVYAVSSGIFVIGMTLPAWGPRVGLEKLWWRVARWHMARRLRPLWTLMTGAYPGVVLDRGLLAASPHRERLEAERLPVEIHDSWLQLRSHLTACDVARVDELAERHRVRDRDAAVTAARLMVALQRKESGEAPLPTAAPLVEHLGAASATTLVAEVHFLCQVSKHLRSRLVRDAMIGVAARP